MGHCAAFSFHETKNISSGQGGMLVINDSTLIERAKIVWEKGTNRDEMDNGKATKYEWVDLGSNFYPSEITAALLYSQLLSLEHIQFKRKQIWEKYYSNLVLLENEGKIQLPTLKSYQSNNYHIFYLVSKTITERDALIDYLKQNDVLAVFHYMCLHKSPYIKGITDFQDELPNAEKYANTLVRLPIFVDLELNQVEKISELIISFYNN
jgi:dTDP-4-amino-4,6-dideoxygalactose transaminase